MDPRATIRIWLKEDILFIKKVGKPVETIQLIGRMKEMVSPALQKELVSPGVSFLNREEYNNFMENVFFAPSIE